ncbi:hypothetical protein [Roseateles sp. BYS96W]|uniref:Lipoprotein n=1 Tax=Pelomonas nitida TaxID=3299027 RepID=A0ABW7G2W4_9BURK
MAWLSALGPTPMSAVLGLISGCAGDAGRITGWCPPGDRRLFARALAMARCLGAR